MVDTDCGGVMVYSAFQLGFAIAAIVPWWQLITAAAVLLVLWTYLAVSRHDGWNEET